MQGLGRGEVEGAVGDDHATERGDRVACERVRIGLGERVAGGQSTSVVVLEDGNRRRIVLELGHELNRGIDIEQVVVAERFAIVLGEEALEVAIVGAGLVGILSVAKRGTGRFKQGEHFGLSALAHPGTNGGIVPGGHAKGGSSHAPAEVEVGAHSIAERIDEVGILAARRDADHVREVLGGSSDEGDATDVDFLDDLPFRSARSQRLFKRIEVHIDQVVGTNAMLGHVGIGSGRIHGGTGCHRRPWGGGFFTRPQHFCGLGDRFDRRHFGAEGLDGLLRSARGEDLHTVGVQFFDDGGKAFLVEDGNQGALDGALHGVQESKGAKLAHSRGPCHPCCSFGGMSRRLFVESFIQAWQSLVTNLRTLLSLLGVMIGIFMITAVFAVSDSLEENLKGIFSSVRSDVLFVEKMPWTFSSDYPWWKYALRRDPTLEDAEMLRDRLPSARSVAFQTGSSVTLERGSNSFEGAQLAAVTLDYPDAIELNLEEGRFFTAREVQAAVPVAVLGRELVDRLFPSGSALGQACTLDGRTVRIIGVLAQEGSSLVGDGFDKVAFIPVTFGRQLVNFRSVKTSILVRARGGVDLETLKGEVIAAYRPLRRLHPRDESDFAVNEVEMLTAFIDVLFGQVEYGVWFIGVFAILIGCFSVTNIMFVSVKERTPLIGVQKALGAKRSFVLAQFLTEAVALCIIGALLALLAVGLLVVGVNATSDGFSLVFGVDRFLLGLGIAVVSGVVAGLAPAMQAARMDPVEAMRAA